MRRRAGQATVEYLLVISFLSIALAAVLYGLYNTLASATASTGSGLATSLTEGGTQP